MQKFKRNDRSTLTINKRISPGHKINSRQIKSLNTRGPWVALSQDHLVQEKVVMTILCRSLLVHSCKSFLFPITEGWNFWLQGLIQLLFLQLYSNTLVKVTKGLHSATWEAFCSHYAWFFNSIQHSFSLLETLCPVVFRRVHSADIAHIPRQVLFDGFCQLLLTPLSHFPTGELLGSPS